jgi:hypothetical protein
MLKYRLKKGVFLEPGMAFKYRTAEEFLAIRDAIRKELVILHHDKYHESLRTSGILILDGEKIVTGYILSKYLTKRDQYIIKKKHIFEKIEYDNGPRDNRGSKYANQSNIVPTHHENINSTIIKSKVDSLGFAKGVRTAEFLKQNDVNKNERVQETLPKLKSDAQGFFDMLHSIKTIVVDGKIKCPIGNFENATSLDGKNVLIYTRKDGSKVIIE